jgi:nitric oxide reductase activation protein
MKTSISSVVEAVKAGANTIEVVGIATDIAIAEDDDRDQVLIENIIKIAR